MSDTGMGALPSHRRGPTAVLWERLRHASTAHATAEEPTSFPDDFQERLRRFKEESGLSWSVIRPPLTLKVRFDDRGQSGGARQHVSTVPQLRDLMQGIAPVRRPGAGRGQSGQQAESQIHEHGFPRRRRPGEAGWFALESLCQAGSMPSLTEALPSISVPSRLTDRSSGRAFVLLNSFRS